MVWIPAALILLTLATTVVAAWRLRAARRSVAGCRGWSVEDGRVIASGIREIPNPDAGTQYLPVVSYRYRVSEVEYDGDRLALGPLVQYSRRRNAERRLARYQPGQAVQVLVDPRNPASSVLECRVPTVPVLWAVLVGAWIILIAGLLLLFLPGVDGPEPLFRL